MMMRFLTAVVSRRLRRAARQHFGWTSLRPGQLTAMRAIVRKRDALVIMPTGGGKSAVYQVPASILPGPTVVISPLLALQHDQITNLNERDRPELRAVRISSAETPRQQDHALLELAQGRAKFLFITPEQLARPERLAEVKALKPSLVAVDEAHCISSWGLDFRPDYLALGHYIEGLGNPPIVALTATASPPVRDDIVTRLRLRNPKTIITGLDRPNLFLEVDYCADENARWRSLLAFLQTQEKNQGIIYVPTRRAAEELAERLCKAKLPAEFYHGGLAGGEREQRHEEFLTDQAPIMVATSAFGMGIDKADIRYVVHMALPDSPDSYLQEIGRAGRDGDPARALLLWRSEDEALQRYFNGGPPDESELCQLAVVLREGPTTKTALAKKTGLGTRKLPQLLELLEQVGAARTLPNNKIVVPPHAPTAVAAARAAVAESERRQAVQATRIEMMRGFAQATGCRGRMLLAYFGEHAAKACGHCDNCRKGTGRKASATPAVPKAREPFAVHSSVRHGEWGVGMVLAYDGDKMTVLFDDAGYKTLSVPVVVSQKLLVAA